VFSDLMMSEMGEMELCSMLQQLDPAVRLVVLTGYPLENGRAALQSAVVGWLRKPVELEQLGQVVARALETGQTSP